MLNIIHTEELGLDTEWMELILHAHEMGLSIEEIRAFLNKEKNRI
ncbi:anti-repressor SinI family protein [Niallia sp. 01092]